MSIPMYYGFEQLNEESLRTLISGNLEVAGNLVQDSIDSYNAEMNQIMQFFGVLTEKNRIKIERISGAQMQPIGQFDVPVPFSTVGPEFMGLPIGDYGISWKIPYKAFARITFEQLAKAQSVALNADMDLIRTLTFRALFNNTPYSYDDEYFGTFMVHPMANGDTTEYIYEGVQVKTDNHYFGQANPISDADNPFTVLYEAVAEHDKLNSGEIVFVVSHTLMSDVSSNLSTFTPIHDSRLILGDDKDQIRNPALGNVPGKLEGLVSGAGYVYSSKKIPNGYIMAISTEGTRPLAYREDVHEELKGFRLRNDTTGENGARSSSWPLLRRVWTRYIGVGGLNRVGAAIMQVGSANYSIPSEYA